METPTLPLFIAIEIGVLAAGHMFQHWKLLWGRLDNPVRLIFNYTYGVMSIVGAFVWWLLYELPTDPKDIARVIIAMSVIGGITVLAAYGIDWIAEWLKSLIEEKKLSDIKKNKNDAESTRT